MKKSLAMLLTVGVFGCGGDPLLGTWVSSSLPSILTGTLAALQQKITFEKGGKCTQSATYTYGSGMDAGAFKGCVVSETYTGTYASTSSGDTQTLVFTMTSGTSVATSCADAGQNHMARPTTDKEIQNSNIGGKAHISDRTMALSTSLSGVEITLDFVKQ